MLSSDGRLVSATAANVFMVEDGRVVTPEIRDCGVAGVMRQVVLAAAADSGLRVVVEDVQPDRLAAADELFVTNAVVGIRPVQEIFGIRRWTAGKVTRKLMDCTA
jgi:4-amino-4-deoxychorismate lyase